MKIKKFEDIHAWREARILANMVFDVIKNSAELTTNYRFKDQIVASSISVMANIAEGFSRRSNKEFIQFLFISKASLAELQSHLYVALDQDFVSTDIFKNIYEQTEKTAKLISKFISYLLSFNKTEKQPNKLKKLNKP